MEKGREMHLRKALITFTRTTMAWQPGANGLGNKRKRRNEEVFFNHRIIFGLSHRRFCPNGAKQADG